MILICLTPWYCFCCCYCNKQVTFLSNSKCLECFQMSKHQSFSLLTFLPTHHELCSVLAIELAWYIGNSRFFSASQIIQKEYFCIINERGKSLMPRPCPWNTKLKFFIHTTNRDFITKWYFVTKIVLTYSEKKLF
jgi:hypothetical protein